MGVLKRHSPGCSDIGVRARIWGFFMKSWKLIAAALGGVVASVGFAIPAGAAPAVTVTPNANLVDGQTVHVAASGFAAGATIAIIECEQGAVDANGCDLGTLFTTVSDSSGSVSEDVDVFRLIFTTNSPPAGTDCVTATCVLAVADLNDITQAASQVLSFDPNGPLPTPLVITTNVNGSGNFDKAGNVTVSGVVTCNQPAEVDLETFLTQRAGRAILQADGFNFIECDGPTPFTVTAQPYNGIFRGGTADLELYVNGFTGRQSTFDEIDTTLHLQGGGGTSHGNGHN
jgi:hypothetical protein